MLAYIHVNIDNFEIYGFYTQTTMPDYIHNKKATLNHIMLNNKANINYIHIYSSCPDEIYDVPP
jgi:hypothetical protein